MQEDLQVWDRIGMEYEEVVSFKPTSIPAQPYQRERKRSEFFKRQQGKIFEAKVDDLMKKIYGV